MKTTDELEMAAYISGDLDRAELLARIAELQKALGESVNEIEQLKTDLVIARHDRAYGGAE
jgi:hypothetical protein